MAVIRGGDRDDVQRLAGEHLAVIAVQGEVCVRPALLELAEGFFVEVASRHEAGAVRPDNPGGVGHANAAAANDSSFIHVVLLWLGVPLLGALHKNRWIGAPLSVANALAIGQVVDLVVDAGR